MAMQRLDDAIEGDQDIEASSALKSVDYLQAVKVEMPKVLSGNL